MKYKWLVFPFILLSCGQLSSHFHIIAANYLYEQGLYQDAIVHYLATSQQTQYSAFIEHNLAICYVAMGEIDSALKIWDNLKNSENPEISSLAYYNQAVVYYQIGQYDKAVSYFHKNLELLPHNLQNKIGLELALNKQHEILNSNRGNPSSLTDKNKNIYDQQIARTLDYLKRKEILFWQTQEQGDQSWQSNNDW
jgi:tetratricopeptide (TPR) repeat protein